MGFNPTMRSPGRPAGKTDQNVAKVLNYLKTQEQPVNASTNALATVTNLSKRQVERSLLTLKRKQRIRVSNRRTPLPQGWANERFIYVEEN